MFDPYSMALVLGGALIATLMQAGLRDAAMSLAAAGSLLRKGFDQDRARSELARQIAQIARDGLLRALPRETGDPELDLATGAMIRDRSLDTLLDRHQSYRSIRAEKAAIASGVFRQAADLSPLLGLAGTLLSLGQLSSLPQGSDNIANAIGMAVTTTFYGVVFAHFLFFPIAGLVERRARAEDNSREQLYAWLEEQVRLATPRRVTTHSDEPERQKP